MIYITNISKKSFYLKNILIMLIILKNLFFKLEKLILKSKKLIILF